MPTAFHYGSAVIVRYGVSPMSQQNQAFKGAAAYRVFRCYSVRLAVVKGVVRTVCLAMIVGLSAAYAEAEGNLRGESVTVQKGSVEEFATLQGTDRLQKKLERNGATRIESSLGTVLLYAEPKERNLPQIRAFSTFLANTLPALMPQVQAVLQQHGFPQHLLRADYPWHIFLERSHRPSGGALSSQRCHAAWMGPPANIFLSLDGFSGRCGSFRPSTAVDKKNDEILSLLVHELAHALEFRLMGRGFSRRQRWHSEGFATWFETLHQDWQHSTIDNRELQKLFQSDWQPALFSGSRADYSRAYVMVTTIVERGGLEDLLRVYEVMDEEQISFTYAVEKTLLWDNEKWNQEVRAWLTNRQLPLSNSWTAKNIARLAGITITKRIPTSRYTPF